MRAIKFRAWDKDDKAMRNWNELILEKDKGDDFYLLGHEESETITEYWHEQILMQHTGLTDYNGQEIYEGDILKESLTHPLQVFLDKGHTSIAFKDMGNPHVQELYQSEIYELGLEVIGNIYEHPELLEQS